MDDFSASRDNPLGISGGLAMPLQGGGLIGPAAGDLAARQQGLAEATEARQARILDKELTLRESELGFRLSDLDERRQQFRQKEITEGFQRSIEDMGKFADAVKEIGRRFKPGSSLDKAIDTQKGIIARYAELVGMDPQIAQAAADRARAFSLAPPKTTTAAPGTAIIQDGQIVGAVPQSPLDAERKVAVLRVMLGREPTEDEKLHIFGARAAESQSRHSPAGPYVNEQGEFIGEGVFDRAKGTTALSVPGQPERGPLPAGAKPVTESSLGRNAMTADQFLKLADEVRDTESSVRAVKRYFDNVKDSEQGWKLLADQFIGQLKTVFGKDINQQEFTTLLQTGQLQGLLGRFRKEVVGGGVMTEQDALRVMSALGGDVSALRNPDVVAELLKNVVKEKLADYEDRLRPIYNEQLKTPRGAFKSKEKIDLDPDRLFTVRTPAAPSQEDLEFTARKYGITVDEVKRRLGATPVGAQ